MEGVRPKMAFCDTLRETKHLAERRDSETERRAGYQPVIGGPASSSGGA